MNLLETIQAAYHATSFDGLTTFQKEALVTAQGILDDVLGDWQPLSVLGLDRQEWVDYYLASLSDKVDPATGEPRWYTLGWAEHVRPVWLLPNDPDSKRPSPVLFPITSFTSPNTAVAMVTWGERDLFTGYGRFEEATVYVLEIYSGVDAFSEVTDRLAEIRKSLRIMEGAGKITAAWRERQNRTTDESGKVRASF